MTKRLACYIPRQNQVKVMGPLIDHVKEFRKDWKPIIIYPSSLMSPLTDVTDSYIDRNFGRDQERLKIDAPADLIAAIKREPFQALVNLIIKVHNFSLRDFNDLAAVCRRVGTKLVSLPHTFESDKILVTDPAEAEKNWDLFCVMGSSAERFIRQQLEAFPNDLARKIMDKTVITGCPEFDPINDIDGDRVRQKYNLPQNKPIVVVATAAIYFHDPATKALGARFVGYRHQGLRTILKSLPYLKHKIAPYRLYLDALSKFCRRNGAYLVAKTRAKHLDPVYLNDYVDQLISDVSYHPFTTLELLKTGSLFFGFYTNTAIEAILAGLYSITSTFISPDFYERPQFLNSMKLLYAKSGGAWNWPGVSRIIDGMSPAAREEMRRLSEAEFKDFRLDPERWEAWKKEHVSYLGTSSEKVMDAISSIC